MRWPPNCVRCDWQWPAQICVGLVTDAFRAWLLQLLRVPAQPAPPPGDARMLLTFRAAPSYFRYKVMAWALKQLSAAAGLVVSYMVLRSNMIMRGGLPNFGWIEQIALLLFLAQLPFSYAVLRLDFEMRWYMLSDRSLRIRDGVLAVRERTMTFANIQNISIRQNPLQRLFGIATVVVRAAGGGGAAQGGRKPGTDSGSHEATFEGVDNAEQIRAAIRERIRLHRDAGLGDPEDAAPGGAPRELMAAGGGVLHPAIDAARRLRTEAAALRHALARNGSAG
jgi:membrane protein YdbS with pleckstrin-like domain